MSVYNDSRFLKKSIESILNQSFTNFEFIIINDCSTDESLKIIKKYQKGDKRIKLISNSKNLGLTKSLNIGLKKAKGNYIARIDADDIAYLTRLEKQYYFLKKKSNVFLVDSQTTIINEKDKQLGAQQKNTQLTNIHKKLAKHNCLTHSTIMFKAKPKVHYREKFIYAQDYDLYLRILTRGLKIAKLPIPLLYHRVRPFSIGFKKKKQQLLFAQKARIFYQQRKKMKQDKYNDFDPQNILKIQNKNNEKLSIEERIIIMMQIGNFKNAKELYKKYCKIEKRLTKTIPFYIFIKNPRIYKFYRRIRYGQTQ